MADDQVLGATKASRPELVIDLAVSDLYRDLRR
jgi:hypothetical protein